MDGFSHENLNLVFKVSEGKWVNLGFKTVLPSKETMKGIKPRGFLASFTYVIYLFFHLLCFLFFGFMLGIHLALLLLAPCLALLLLDIFLVLLLFVLYLALFLALCCCSLLMLLLPTTCLALLLFVDHVVFIHSLPCVVVVHLALLLFHTKYSLHPPLCCCYLLHTLCCCCLLVEVLYSPPPLAMCKF